MIAQRRTPSISVLVPVHNAQRYVAASLHSVLAQSWQDFELIVFDDGSTDESPRIIEQIAREDSRILFQRHSNRGMARTLNAMLQLARGQWIARLDADDEALPQRFARQIDFLSQHPECVVVGSAVECIDEDSDPYCVDVYPLEHAEIEARMLAGGGGIIHPATMIRRDAMVQAGGYATDCPVVEDQDLWLRLALRGRLANLPDPLTRYRVHAQNMSFTAAEAASKRLAEVLARARRERGLSAAVPLQQAGSAAADAWDRRRHWAWSAVHARNLATARKHARRLVAERPGDRRGWTLLAYAYFPQSAERLRGWRRGG